MESRVAVGKFGSPYGVRGWIKIISYTQPVQKIMEYLPWFTFRDNQQINLGKVKVKQNGNNVIALLETCHDRDEAKKFTNLEIYINRDQLPPLAGDEFYWIDLIGLQVLNTLDESFGVITKLFNTGSNDVIVVQENSGKERLIPYIESVIITVDLENKKMIVDWDADF